MRPSYVVIEGDLRLVVVACVHTRSVIVESIGVILISKIRHIQIEIW